jgi:hypothetical protein
MAKRNIELDVVASLDDGCTLLGEIKWSSRPVGPLHVKTRGCTSLASAICSDRALSPGRGAERLGTHDVRHWRRQQLNFGKISVARH